ncbi:hypothetical protein [Methanococcoides methylutens]|uniref:hypothetical protein n=1 Tax=Methanococcoides methylutens TaxID=2226 RepID=UPI0012E07ED7|nr:hypothetical protein [Methanococcoides methylutens]
MDEDNMKKSERFIMTLPPYLKGKLEQLAEDYGCSQAEVLRAALIKLNEGPK